jgi:hypothetical protein
MTQPPRKRPGAAAAPVPISSQRQRLIEHGLDRLTDVECADGWHLCAEWDGMLIHPTWPEAECCTCKFNHTFH